MLGGLGVGSACRRHQHQHCQDHHVTTIQQVALPRHHVALQIEEDYQHGHVHHQLLVGLPGQHDGGERHTERPAHENNPPIPPVHTEPVEQESEVLHELRIGRRLAGRYHGGNQAKRKEPHAVQDGGRHSSREQGPMLSLAADHLRELGEAGSTVRVGVALERKQAAEDNGDVQGLPHLASSVEGHRPLPGVPTNQRVDELGDSVHDEEAHCHHHRHDDTHIVSKHRRALHKALHPQRFDIKRNERQRAHHLLPRSLPLDIHITHHTQGLHAGDHSPEAHRGPQHRCGVGRHGGVSHVICRHHQEQCRKHGENSGPQVGPARAHCALIALEVIPARAHAAGDACAADCAFTDRPDLHEGPIGECEIQHLPVAVLRGHALPDIKPIRRGAVRDMIPKPGIRHHLPELAENLSGALAALGHLPVGAVRVVLEADEAGGALALAHGGSCGGRR
mmetsp:Transcript_12944/g.32375  ORF Transcript_12944/g.32375 Transcript_12944/m.32375 type:complete len:450 (+) Transcript_12944:787-2136(+)